MANMSYCRFENTYRDLQDCVNNIHNVNSDSEKRYMERMRQLCEEFIEEYDMMEMSEDEENDDDEEDNE